MSERSQIQLCLAVLAAYYLIKQHEDNQIAAAVRRRRIQRQRIYNQRKKEKELSLSSQK